MATATVEKPKFDLDVMFDQIDKKYHEKWGHTRKIIHLFDNYYRVNYFCHTKENSITESHFLYVTPDGIVERE